MNFAQTRALRPDDLPAAHALTAGFGWPHRLEDWQFMLAHGDGIAAERDGVLVGTGMGWRYGTDGAALGMISVAPAAQGQGLGRRIMELVLAGLGTRRVLLHATEAGLKLYRSLGFVTCGIVRQYQGVAIAGDAMAAVERLRPATPGDGKVLAALDEAATGMDRSALLAALLQQADGVVLEQGGETAGFALRRRFGRGHVIGPVIAPDAERARALIDFFLASLTGAFVRVDSPEAAGLGSWLTLRGLEDAGPAVRMARGDWARILLSRPSDGGFLRSDAHDLNGRCASVLKNPRRAAPRGASDSPQQILAQSRGTGAKPGAFALISQAFG